MQHCHMGETHLAVPKCRHNGARRFIADEDDLPVAHRDEIIRALHRLPARDADRSRHMSECELVFGTNVDEIINASAFERTRQL